MKKLPHLALVAAAALALSGCGKSDKATEGAEAENVEVPADETMNEADATAMPAPEASSEATAAASAPAASTSAAVDKATRDAEKKM